MNTQQTLPKFYLAILVAIASILCVVTYLALLADMYLLSAGSAAIAIILFALCFISSKSIAFFSFASLLLVALIALQSFHTVEHVVQVLQFYIFDKVPAASQGLLKALNAEWVHFVWNWLVFFIFLFIVIKRGSYTKGSYTKNWGERIWATAFIAWALLHSLEHTYLLIRHLALVGELRALGLPIYEIAQNLPGILGRDGWLANSDGFLAICGRIAGLTTLPRVSIHFWWNAGELFLLLMFSLQVFKPVQNNIQTSLSGEEGLARA